MSKPMKSAVYQEIKGWAGVGNGDFSEWFCISDSGDMTILMFKP